MRRSSAGMVDCSIQMARKQKMHIITTCRHNCVVKNMTVTRALMEGIFKILSLSEILPVYLVDRLYLSVAVRGDKYCIFGWVQEDVKANCYMLKICHSELQNVANLPRRGKLWSLEIMKKLSQCSGITTSNKL